MNHVIEPGSTIGVLGGGQLGRMFAIAARRLGYRVHTLSPDADSPLGQLADVEITADYRDLDAVRGFAQAVDVVTFEFENVPAATAVEAERWAPVRPAGELLRTTQHRVREKSALVAAGFPVTPHRVVRSLYDLVAATKSLGGDGVLKTAGWGYDGKGQIRLRRASEATDAWNALGTTEALYERFIPFAREVSVIAARSVDGESAHYGVLENVHRNHVLHTTVAPGAVSELLKRQAVDIVQQIMVAWKVVGVLCAEFFVSDRGELMINELAPRPHNSGHLTIDACVTCQFEQQVRAVCGLPLGDTRFHSAAAMINLLGDVWLDQQPDWHVMCRRSNVKFHLYGKGAAKPGRKMGHLTVLAPTPAEALSRAKSAYAALTGRSGASE